jgi:polar amino acid transport system substrate-binding protein
LLLVFALALGACALSACLPGGGATEPHASLKAIQARKRIVIGTSSGYVPFEMLNRDGELIGFDIELGERIGRELGVTVEWKDVANFRELIPSLEAGQFDIALAGLSIMASRALTVDYTLPYFRTGQAVAVNRDVRGVTSWRDLDQAGTVVAVAAGTSGEIAAHRLFQKATVRAVDGSALAGLEVLSGRAQAVVYDLDWISIFADDNSDKVYAILEPFTVESLGIAVRPGQMDLVYWLNTFLTEFVGDEEYEDLYDYYFRDMRWKAEMPPR